MHRAPVRDGVGVPEGAVLVATRNPGKAAELRALVTALDRPVVDLTTAGIPYRADEDAIENAETFEENAMAKARYFYALSGGAPVIADDSGLCVTALDGAPGVRSRRYAGATGSEAEVSAANSRLLLDALEGETDRHAEFVCAVAYVDATTAVVTVGRTAGRILTAPAGASGFGYDPLFWSDELRASFGEVDARAKARVSHRARAVDALLATLRSKHVAAHTDVDAQR